MSSRLDFYRLVESSNFPDFQKSVLLDVWEIFNEGLNFVWLGSDPNEDGGPDMISMWQPLKLLMAYHILVKNKLLDIDAYAIDPTYWAVCDENEQITEITELQKMLTGIVKDGYRQSV